MLRAFLLSLATLLGAPVAAQVEPYDPASVEVDVELLLLVDVSRSMTPNELEIQRRGYAEALVSDAVLNAIGAGFLGHIAIAYVEWAGSYSQRVVNDWAVIGSLADAQAFAQRLESHFSTGMRRTSISSALTMGAAMFDDNGFTGLRRVIDISGDGPNNDGMPVLSARDAVLARGITINGLPLMTQEGMGSHWQLEDLDLYYTDCVIGGTGSFVIPVNDWSEFAAAVRRKLVLEIAGRQPDPVPPQARRARVLRVQSGGGYDCLVGEKIWENYRNNWEP
ncbi:DUF1194 domain-containing protein [Pseudooceanicola sp.]|jgi:hypothetical protein|uniref:DUF1194 domain-containing protein n=1 Tax=Pseudooceanicola TaxID=1679449 RepID=UPI003512B2A0